MPAYPVPIFVGQQTDAADYNDRLPINLYAVAQSVRGDSAYLISQDGLKFMSSVDRPSALGDRGAIYNERQNVHLRVIGDALIVVGQDGSNQVVNTISGVGQCSTAYSFNSTLIVSGGMAFRVLDNFQVDAYQTQYPILDAVWTGGYYIFTDGGKIFHTRIANEAELDPLGFDTSDLSPDPTVGLLVTQEGLLVSFDRFSTQYFYNAGSVPFSFQRLPQKSINAGIVGTHAKTMLLGDIFILGGRKTESPSFYIVSTGDIKPISTRSVDKILAEYTADELASVVLESRVDERTALMIARLPRHTLCFNWTFAQAAGFQNAWSIMSTGNTESPWIGCNGIFDPVMRKWVYGNVANGRIYELDKDSAAQDGQPVETECQTPIVPLRGRIGKVELNTITGYGDGASVFISASSDAAFFAEEWVQAMPVRGVYGGRYIVNRLGYFPDEFIIRIRAVSTSKVNWSGMKVYAF